MNDHPDIFPIRLGDLRDGLLDQVVTEVRHFAVPLMLNDDFIGSGWPDPFDWTALNCSSASFG